jgi:glycosyltransferase involved in cell wall biosynthesis
LNVLVVSQYFRPEAGATQNRLGAFADGLVDRGHRVTVICEQPNHPAGVFQPGYGRRPCVTERSHGLTVHRLWVATSRRKTTMRRLAFYGTFAAGAAAIILGRRRFDVCLATSPPLPGVLAVSDAARVRRIPLVVDVRDIWPAAAQALGELSNRRVIAALERAERRLYRQARRVTATTLPFCRHIDRVAGTQKSVHVPNGALDELVAFAPTDPPPRDEFVVGYAGNLGIAQGLRIALDAAELLRGTDVRFALLGDGPVQDELEAEIAQRGLADVISLDPGIPVAEVGDFLRSCDALLVPLRDHPLLDDFIPSKLYDAMAVGRPVLVAARGEAAQLTAQTVAGIVVSPEDGAGLATAVRRLASEPALAQRLGQAGRRAAAGLTRSKQVDVLEQVLLDAASHG